MSRFILLSLIIFLCALPAWAQTTGETVIPVIPAPQENTLTTLDDKKPSAPPKQVITPQPPSVTSAVEGHEEEKMASLFFTNNQLMSIMRANQGFIAPREAYDEKNQADKPVDPGPRILTLAGIVYHGTNDWTIWFNGTRVTPDKIPDRILGLTVESDKVFVRWMDIGNQRIVNITLRPNEKYLLDNDTILTGTK